MIDTGFEIPVQSRVVFPEEAREKIHSLEQENDELKKRVEELMKALSSEATEHGGTMRERDEALVKAGKDPLTELYNRDKAKEMSLELLKLAKRGEIKVALIRLDIDFFKKINDLNGHLWGDQVLISVAKKISHIKRDTDIASRFGGEEFDIMLPLPTDTHQSKIGQIVSRYLYGLNDLVRNNPSGPDNPDHITASFGVAIVNPGEDIPYEVVSQMADDALYVAKDEGRNRIKIIYAHDDKVIKSRRLYFEPGESMVNKDRGKWAKESREAH